MKRLNLSPIDGKLRLTFFCRPGLDNFLNPLYDALAPYYWTRKVLVNDTGILSKEMEQTDICWFEWCDHVAVAGSREPLASERIMICRLHSYEAFTSYIYHVNWSVMDRTIFVGDHIRDYVLARVPALRKDRTSLLTTGVDMGKYTFAERQAGFNLAYVGYINHKKGPALLLQAFKAIHNRDPRYKLFIAGVHQEVRFRLYMDQLIKELNLADSIEYVHWQTDINQFLEDKHYLLSASPLEGQFTAGFEAMAKGVKPLIHNFYGAENIYDRAFLWNSIDELVERVQEEKYDSAHYRSFIEERYALPIELGKVLALFHEAEEEAIRPD